MVIIQIVPTLLAVIAIRGIEVIGQMRLRLEPHEPVVPAGVRLHHCDTTAEQPSSPSRVESLMAPAGVERGLRRCSEHAPRAEVQMRSDGCPELGRLVRLTARSPKRSGSGETRRRDKRPRTEDAAIH